MSITFCGQKYAKLKKKALSDTMLFVDDVFPAQQRSLSGNPKKYGEIQWKRPKDINASARFMVSKEGDMSSGKYGNKAVAAACSCLCSNKPLMQKVVPRPEEQEWAGVEGTGQEDNTKYAGIAHFVIWHNGLWHEVVVDDQLPTAAGKLVFTQSPVNFDFWYPLLEKAYAKLLGSYEKLEHADMIEILEDFTGGIGETTLVKDDDDSQEALFRTITEDIENKSLIPAIVSAKPTNARGLRPSHGYGVTAIKRVTLTGSPVMRLVGTEKINVIRLRDPWSMGSWTGTFGHESEEWKACDAFLQKKLGIKLDTDNEFWMTFNDFCTTFEHIVVCRLMRDKYYADISSEWGDPHKAGGSIDHKATFLSNPQFVFTVFGREDEVVICLLQNFDGITPQKSTKSISPEEPTECRRSTQLVGFTVLKVEENRTFRLHQMMDVVKTSEYKSTRSVVMRHFFTKGCYLVVPTLLEPHQTGSFRLRIFTSAKSKAMELELDKPKEAMCSNFCSCLTCCRNPAVVTQVIVLSAWRFDTAKTEPNPYCIIRCENVKVVSSVCKNTMTPEWNCGALIYRRYHTSVPVKIQLWNTGLLKDSFLGEVVLQARLPVDREEEDYPMFDRHDTTMRRPGYIRIRLTVSPNMLIV